MHATSSGGRRSRFPPVSPGLQTVTTCTSVSRVLLPAGRAARAALGPAGLTLRCIDTERKGQRGSSASSTRMFSIQLSHRQTDTGVWVLPVWRDAETVAQVGVSRDRALGFRDEAREL